MALPNSGPLSLSSIQGEFGGSNPIGLNEYYRGGPLVGNFPGTSNIPTSGTIAVNNFYGTTASIPNDRTAQFNYGQSSTGGKFPIVTQSPNVGNGSWNDRLMTSNNIGANFADYRSQQAFLANTTIVSYNTTIPASFFSGLTNVVMTQPNGSVIDVQNNQVQPGYNSSVASLANINSPVSSHGGAHISQLLVQPGNPCIVNYT